MNKVTTKRLNQLVTIQKGKLATAYPTKLNSNFLPIINAEAFSGKYALFGPNVKGLVTCSSEDVIMLWDGERSGLVTVGHEGIIGSTTARLKPNEDILGNYLFYHLKQKFDWIQQNRTGTGVPHVPKDLGKILLLRIHENPAEQQKIAKILQTVDGQIEKTEGIIAKYKAIKQGLMQDLFTRGINVATGKLRPSYQQAPELYKPSPLGMIPKEWDAKMIGILTEKVGSGSTPTGGSEVYTDEGVLFIRSQNVLEGKLSLLDAAFITEAINERMAGSKVKPFDVLLNITGASIGRSAYFPDNLGSANVNQHVCIIRFPEPSKELAVVVSAFLNSPYGQNQIFRFNAGGNREGLNFQQIRSFFFPEMDDKEVKLISQKLEAISTTIESELLNLDKLHLIKKGLMADLLSGKVRVQVDEEAMC